MRKSAALDKPLNGNATKFLSYREAWTRISAACADAFFLEAVTIEESIITDRLIAYLTAVGAPISLDNANQFPSFSKVIRRWRECHAEAITIGQFTDLQDAVDRWRQMRNQVVHGMVKSHAGSATLPIDDFLKAAAQAAEEGIALARAVSNWTRKAIREQSKKTATALLSLVEA